METKYNQLESRVFHWEGTLEGKLKRLEQLRKENDEFGICTTEEDLNNAKLNVLREFYEENPLAREVSEGKTSYTESIEPILKKYGSFWRRIWTPKGDEAFDTEVRKVINSMKNVGISLWSSAKFTITERKMDALMIDGLGLLAGCPFAGIIAVFAYGPILSNSSAEIIMKTCTAIGFAVPYITFKLMYNSVRKKELYYLRQSAQKTDEYLRKHRL